MRLAPEVPVQARLIVPLVVTGEPLIAKAPEDDPLFTVKPTLVTVPELPPVPNGPSVTPLALVNIPAVVHQTSPFTGLVGAVPGRQAKPAEPATEAGGISSPVAPLMLV